MDIIYIILVYQIKDSQQESFNLCNRFSLCCLVSWMNHLRPVWWYKFRLMFLNHRWCVSLIYWRWIFYWCFAFINNVRFIMLYWNSDKSPCSKALISDRHQTPGDTWQNTHNMIKCQVVLWIDNIKQMCLQTALESVNGLSTLDGDRERVPEGRGSLHKATLAKAFQTIMRCRQ